MILVTLILNSVLLGIGLAMDAFSVSLANGLSNPCMKRSRMCGMAGVFAIFQFAMPLTGWICLHTIVGYFTSFQKFIPWIALILLLFIGIKMLIEGVRENRGITEGCTDVVEEFGVESNLPVSSSAGKRASGKADGVCPTEKNGLSFKMLMTQGIATSIDALSVGFTISDHDFGEALLSSLIIGAVTFGICMAGIRIGKKFGERLAGNAQILGGIILIAIGLEIFIKGMFFG